MISLVASNGPSAVGGLTTVLRRIADEFAQTCPVQIVARFAGDGPPGVSYTAREAPRTLEAGSLPVHIIAPPGIATPGLSLARRLSYRQPLQGLARRMFTMAYRRPIEKVLPQSVEIVHSIGAGWEMLGFPALQAARHRGAIFTVCPAIHPGVWGDSRLDATLYRAADVVFALSQFERTRLVDIGVRPERVVVTACAPGNDHHGDGRRFRARHRLGDCSLVLFIGRKQRYKGYHALCEAMSILQQSVPRCRLVSIGPDGEMPYPPVPDGVLDLGRCSEQDKADALAACDVFCLPSTEESFGIVYVEAWAAGKPVVAGLAPAVRELVREGVDGFCTSQEPAAIAAILAEMLRSPELCMRLGEAGMQRQRRDFTWPVVAATHFAAFAEAQARRAVAPT